MMKICKHWLTGKHTDTEKPREYCKLEAENAQLKEELALSRDLRRSQAQVNGNLSEQLAKEREKVKELEDKISAMALEALSAEGQWMEHTATQQATIAEMREADLKIVGRNLTEEMALAAARLFDKANGRRVGAETLWRVLFDAAPPLTLPPNQDALHEARALECERLAACYEPGWIKNMLEREAAAHRARKEGK